jgi:putative FmdB family regulatory protein
MPMYVYLCPACKQEQTRLVQWIRADQQKECPCGHTGYIDRVPTAPSFSVLGFNAKNGYSK